MFQCQQTWCTGLGKTPAHMKEWTNVHKVTELSLWISSKHTSDLLWVPLPPHTLELDDVTICWWQCCQDNTVCRTWPFCGFIATFCDLTVESHIQPESQTLKLMALLLTYAEWNTALEFLLLLLWKQLISVLPVSWIDRTELSSTTLKLTSTFVLTFICPLDFWIVYIECSKHVS